jgi:ribosomal protein S18 acetylase RimI-like enzyme
MVVSTKNKNSITPDDIRLFLSNAGNSLENFRYFKSRNIDVFNNHLQTILIYIDDAPVGYGHLDKDREDVWLGICVVEANKGNGIGKLIMRMLLDFAVDSNVEKIKLTVDKTNDAAIKMYHKYGFTEVKEHKTDIILMELNLKKKA